MAHRWQFFRAGAVDQVSLRDGADLLALRDLDPKLWVALAMPTRDIDVDRATLELLDADKDGRIRIQDILAAIEDIERCFREPSDVLTSSPTVELATLADDKVVASARRILADLGKPDASAISVDDTASVTKAFETTVLNGDGVVIPESASAPAIRAAIADAIACGGSVTDRSGKPGIDRSLTDAFFADVDAQAAWLAAGKELVAHDAAADAYLAVKDKLDDYFTRCQLAAFDARAQPVLGGVDADLAAIASKLLSSSDPQIAQLPIARVDPGGRLPLRTGINPAWVALVARFADATVAPLLGARDELTQLDVPRIAGQLAPLLAWRAARPATKLGGLSSTRIAELAAPEVRAAILELIARDAALAEEYDQLAAVAKIVRLRRDFGRVLRNFVNFSDFYSKRDGAFQAGTLYLDGRALHLCVPVADASKHGALAGSSDTCLVYCDVQRAGASKQIVAALTNGDADNIFVGRNGVFYDRDGRDWDASVVKVITNPISVREAFWAPYKKLVRLIEENVTRRAQAADAAAQAKLDAAAQHVAKAEEVGVATAASGGTPPAHYRKIDLGTIAAIGVAIGGIGTLVGALLNSMFSLGRFLPLGLAALVLMISGPSMVLAWLKLRRRNLGPILDANGWAINSRARINVAFGAAMTELAKIPPGSQRVLSDPFADKQPPWRLYVSLAVPLVLAGTWYVGRFDQSLPVAVRSVTVLGASAPAYRAPVPPAAPAAPATSTAGSDATTAPPASGSAR